MPIESENTTMPYESEFPENVHLPNKYYTVREAAEIIFEAGGGNEHKLKGTASTNTIITQMAEQMRARLQYAGFSEFAKRERRGTATRVCYPNYVIYSLLESDEYVAKLINQCLGLPTTKKARRLFIQERKAAARAAASAETNKPT